MPRRSVKPLVNVLLEPELLEALDDFRFTHRFPSRAATIKYLMISRLQQKPVPTPEDRIQGRRLSA